MSALSINVEPHAVLHQQASEVAVIDRDVAALADTLLSLMHAANGIGLAAPQVGLAHRMFVMCAPGDIERVMINPQIVAQSEQEVVLEEGCLSIPGIFADVRRPQQVTITGYDQRGASFELTADGMQARVALHEIDHLNGVLFWDRVPRHIRRRLQREYTDTHHRA